MDYESAKALWNAEIGQIGPLYGAAAIAGVALNLPLNHPREMFPTQNESVVKFLRKWADVLDKE